MAVAGRWQSHAPGRVQAETGGMGEGRGKRRPTGIKSAGGFAALADSEARYPASAGLCRMARRLREAGERGEEAERNFPSDQMAQGAGGRGQSAKRGTEWRARRPARHAAAVRSVQYLYGRLFQVRGGGIPTTMDGGRTFISWGFRGVTPRRMGRGARSSPTRETLFPVQIVRHYSSEKAMGRRRYFLQEDRFSGIKARILPHFAGGR